jgi:hypothetical protein
MEGEHGARATGANGERSQLVKHTPIALATSELGSPTIPQAARMSTDYAADCTWVPWVCLGGDDVGATSIAPLNRR